MPVDSFISILFWSMDYAKHADLCLLRLMVCFIIVPWYKYYWCYLVDRYDAIMSFWRDHFFLGEYYFWYMISAAETYWILEEILGYVIGSLWVNPCWCFDNIDLVSLVVSFTPIWSWLIESEDFALNWVRGGGFQVQKRRFVWLDTTVLCIAGAVLLLLSLLVQRGLVLLCIC